MCMHNQWAYQPDNPINYHSIPLSLCGTQLTQLLQGDKFVSSTYMDTGIHKIFHENWIKFLILNHWALDRQDSIDDDEEVCAKF